jgi:hypothetical protein
MSISAAAVQAFRQVIGQGADRAVNKTVHQKLAIIGTACTANFTIPFACDKVIEVRFQRCHQLHDWLPMALA